MFNDKITKNIIESAKKVLEAKEEVPPVVMGRLPASAHPKKKVTRKAIMSKRECRVKYQASKAWSKVQSIDYEESND